MRDLRHTLRDLAEPPLNRMGLDLVAVEIVSGRRRTVRLSVDKPGGVDAGDCARASVRLGPVFDEADPIDSPWQLEVSSPGIERPVQRLDDFRRFTGFKVRLRLAEGHARRRYTGVISRVDDDTILLDDGTDTHPLAFDDIDAAHLVLTLEEFQSLADGPPPLPDEAPPAGPEEVP